MRLSVLKSRLRKGHVLEGLGLIKFLSLIVVYYLGGMFTDHSTSRGWTVTEFI